MKMSFFSKLPVNYPRILVWGIIVFPLFTLLISLFTKPLANPVEFIIHETGDSTLLLLVITLWLSPLQVLFPRFTFLKKVVRHRRTLGLACFFYACLHLAFYLLDIRGAWDEMVDNLIKVFVILGLAAFFILFILAITSNRWSIRKLTGKKWKRLHRLVYLAIILAGFHLVLRDEGLYERALIYLLPLSIAELYRLFRYLNPSHKT